MLFTAIILISLIIILISTRLLMSGGIRTPLYHDDADAAATTGLFTGGEKVDWALVKEWDGICRKIGGYDPHFRGFDISSFDVGADETPNMTWASIRNSNWLPHHAIYKHGIHHDELTTSAGTLHVNDLWRKYLISLPYDIRCALESTFDEDETKTAPTIIAADVGILYYITYGRPPVRNPNNRLLIVGDVAEAATGAADAYDEAWNQRLTKGFATSPQYLDADKQYNLVGTYFLPGAKDKLAVAAKLTVAGFENWWLAGFGSGNMLNATETIYPVGIGPFPGDTEIKAETIGGATDTPFIAGIFEELGLPDDMRN